MNGDAYLGIDVGTSSTKVVLLDEEGAVRSRATESYPTTHLGTNRAEQDPEDWWLSLCRATRRVLRLADVTPGRVRALSLSTQGGTLAPVDQANQPTRPAIVWTDTRASAERSLVLERLSERDVYHDSGWFLGNGLNLLQVLWLQRNEPNVVKATKRFLSVHDYLCARLSGRYVLDPSNGAVNQLADFRTGRWSNRLLDAANLSPSQLGEVQPAGTVVGPLLPGAAEELGLSSATLVVNGGHDQLCVALGLGAVAPGQAFVGTGTAWVAAVITAKPKLDYDAGLCAGRHVVPDRYASLMSLEAGGACLEWWRRLVSPSGVGPTFAELDARIPNEPSGLPMFLPFLQGCPYPLARAGLRGQMLGVEVGHTAWDIGASVLTGVSNEVAWMLEGLTTSADDHPVLITGGASRSLPWMQTLANITCRPVQVAEVDDSGAVGAASLAAGGLGIHLPQSQDGHIVEPDNHALAWQEQFQAFKEATNAALAHHSQKTSM